MALQFTRNANVYVQLVDAAGSHVQAWKLSVLDGFSFTQSINSSEITINEAGTTSRRARLLFNDSLAPVEWSMSTYARPFNDASPDEVHCPEEVLWAMALGADTYDAGTRVFSNSVVTQNTNTFGSGTNTFNFNGSNVSSFSDRFNIYFSFEETGNTQVYKLESAVVNSVTMDFDIEGIATLQWSGFSKALTDAGTSVPGDLSSPIEDGLTSTTNFIRNRISTVDLIRKDKLIGSPSANEGSPAAPNDIYNIVLTGGSFTIENNISYLTPEELGVVNAPLANITGARSISGSLTCYLDNDVSNSKSGELFADLVSDTTTVRNIFDMAVNIGGTTTGTPRVAFDLPTAHLEVPTINVEDLLTLEINFHGQVANGNVDNTNEATIIYKA
jgi:hypothetical protein